MKLPKLKSYYQLVSSIIFSPIESLKKSSGQIKNQYYKKLLLKKYQKSQLPTIDLKTLFPDLNEKLNVYTFLPGTSSIPDLILLKLLAKRLGRNCDYLEIGSWRGESAVNLKSLCHSITMITLGSEEMKSKGFSEAFINQNELFTKGDPEFKVIHSDSQIFDFNRLGQKFDLIFVDGDHQYHAIVSDTKKVFNLRKNNSSIIVWHDYGFDAEEVRNETLAAILIGIPADKHQHLYHMSNTMCAVYLEDFEGATYTSQFPSKPTKIFEIQVTSKSI